MLCVDVIGDLDSNLPSLGCEASGMPAFTLSMLQSVGTRRDGHISGTRRCSSARRLIRQSWPAPARPAKWRQRVREKYSEWVPGARYQVACVLLRFKSADVHIPVRRQTGPVPYFLAWLLS